MKNKFLLAFLPVFFATGLYIPSVFAQTIQTPPDTQLLITSLQEQIAALQEKIAALAVSESQIVSSANGFTRDLFLGSEGDDVRALQTFLAKDAAIYPEGLVTGYFGALTGKAVQRFQTKYEIVSSGLPEITGYGRVGPRTRAKLNELTTRPPIVLEQPQAQQETLAPPEEQIGAAPPEEVVAPSEVTATTSASAVSPPKPTPNIKSGTGLVTTNSTFDFGTGVLHYKELGRISESGAFYLSTAGGGRTTPSFAVANIISSQKSGCDPHDAVLLAGMKGPKSICEFIDAANYTFSDKETLVRFHEKDSLCYDGMILFRQNGLYGGIEPQDVTKNGDLTYRYWYDASGGSDFSDACLLGKNSAQSSLASVLGSLADILNKIQREIKKISQ